MYVCLLMSVYLLYSSTFYLPFDAISNAPPFISNTPPFSNAPAFIISSLSEARPQGVF